MRDATLRSGGTLPLFLRFLWERQEDGEFLCVKGDVFAIPSLEVPATSALDLNSDLHAGIKVIGIASILSASLNNASGRRLTEVEPTAFDALRNLLQREHGSWDQLPRLDNPATTTIRNDRARLVMEQNLQYWIEHPADAGFTLNADSEGGSPALREILSDVTAGRSRLGAHAAGISEMLFSKWATRSDFEGNESFASPTIPRACGPALRTTIERNVNGIQSPTDSPFTLRQIAAHVDLWVFNTKQEKILVAVALCSRVLKVLSPILLVTRSQKTAHLLLSRAFAHRLQPGPEMRDFLRQQYTRLRLQDVPSARKQDASRRMTRAKVDL